MMEQFILKITFLKSDINLCSNFAFGQGTSAIVHFFIFKLEYGYFPCTDVIMLDIPIMLWTVMRLRLILDGNGTKIHN